MMDRYKIGIYTGKDETKYSPRFIKYGSSWVHNSPYLKSGLFHTGNYITLAVL